MKQIDITLSWILFKANNSNLISQSSGDESTKYDFI